MTNIKRTRKERIQQQKKANAANRKGLWKKILLGVAILFATLFIAIGITIITMIQSAPDLAAEDLQTPHSTIIYDQNDELVTTVFREENRVRTEVDDIPKRVKDAVISIEDKRFYDHGGIDLRRIFGAALSNIKNGWGSEGGSTITQQVIKQSVLTPEKTLTRKVQEAWLALKLEREYSKDEILEMYLNNIYFGQRSYGIKTAAETYFNKEDLNDLTISQAALLAGLPNAPSAYNPIEHPGRAKKRRAQVITAMLTNDVISEVEANDARDLTIEDILEPKQREENSPYIAFVDTVYEQLVKRDEIVSEEEFFQDGLEIYTTLDAKAQEAVYDILESKEIPYPDQDFETGIALVDTETGSIQAIGGGRNFKAISYINYGSKAKHHPGSTIKPILDYGPAIEYLKWPTSHILSDEPYSYSDGTEVREWDNKYWGDVSMRRSLEWSRNIPALKALQSVGLDKAQTFVKGLGIDIDPMNESAALGSFKEGASPLQMATAYAAFGNGGTYNEPHAVKEIIFPDGEKWEPEKKPEQAMQDYTAYMITDMLKDVITTGTGAKANVEGIPVAGKTGSTNIPKEQKEKYGISDGILDAWFAGYTPKHSLAVWTGYPSLKNKDDEVQYIKNDGTQDIARHIFKELMTEISDPDMSDFAKPDSVGIQGSELYIKGNDPAPAPTKKQKETNEKDESDSEEPEADEDQEEEPDDEEDEDEEEIDDEQEKEDKEPVEEENDETNEEQSDDQKEEENKQENEEQPKEEPDHDESKDENKDESKKEEQVPDDSNKEEKKEPEDNETNETNETNENDDSNNDSS